jgi:membrane-associated phospholipid phosphatase
MRITTLVIGWVVVATLGSVPAGAQTAPADSGSGKAPLFDKRDWYWAAGFATAAAVAVPLDRSLQRVSQRPALHASRIISRSSAGARLLGHPGAVILGGAIYAGGRVSGNDHAARLGLHTAEAVVLGDLITGTIKVVAGRKRPYASPDNPHNFQLFRGLKGDSVRSFPSGHATSAFAAAAAATAETGYFWKEGKPYVGAALFTAAGIVGLSRMYHNDHWASDVAVGAAIGTFVGWKVVRYSHEHPSNTPDDFFLRNQRSPAVTQPRTSRSRTHPGIAIPITFSIPAP